MIVDLRTPGLNLPGVIFVFGRIILGSPGPGVVGLVVVVDVDVVVVLDEGGSVTVVASVWRDAAPSATAPATANPSSASTTATAANPAFIRISSDPKRTYSLRRSSRFREGDGDGDGVSPRTFCLCAVAAVAVASAALADQGRAGT
jgi:hypothetical protein